MKLEKYKQNGESAGQIEVSDKIFGVGLNMDLLHQAVVTRLANKRKVLAHTKGRAEVRGGGKKPWRQKGTGRARAGSSRSPIWIGGGVTFGPTKERNFSKKINKKMNQKAIFMALSDKVKNENIFVLDSLKIEEFKTKTFNEILGKTVDTKNKKENEKKIRRSVLTLVLNSDEKARKSGANLTGVEILNLDNINLLDLLKYKNLLITEEAIKKLEERYK